MCSAFADHVQHLVHVEPSLLAKGNRLAQALYQPGNANLVHHFGQLTSAALAHVGEGFGKSHAHGLRCRKRKCIASAHHRQEAVLRSSLTARDRRINKVQAEVLGHSE